ncbi:MAG TPA: DUF3667 domain-containing protein [Candidatus Angelobacter sp.]|jgi:hypothetical protein|nr:DUF3667 domain-containing protein [Candidatus Angelobacter sp.]
MATQSATETASSKTQAVVCAGCGSQLNGPFCSHCGERALGHHEFSVWHFISHHFLHELSHVDGKIARTLRYLFFRPGFLTEEYFAGRRLTYVNPVRLMLTAVIAFALLVHSSGFAAMNIRKLRLSLLPPGIPQTYGIEDTIKRLDLFGILSARISRMKSADLEKEAAVEKFHHELKNYSTVLSFSNVVLLAAFLFLLFHRRRPYFLQHLVYSLHVASFVLLFSIIPLNLFRLIFYLGQGRVATGSALAAMVVVMFLEIMYLHRSMLRFYFSDDAQKRKGWSGAAWATRAAAILVFVGNSAALTLVYFVGAAIALARL